MTRPQTRLSRPFQSPLKRKNWNALGPVQQIVHTFDTSPSWSRDGLEAADDVLPPFFLRNPFFRSRIGRVNWKGIKDISIHISMVYEEERWGEIRGCGNILNILNFKRKKKKKFSLHKNVRFDCNTILLTRNNRTFHAHTSLTCLSCSSLRWFRLKIPYYYYHISLLSIHFRLQIYIFGWMDEFFFFLTFIIFLSCVASRKE